MGAAAFGCRPITAGSQAFVQGWGRLVSMAGTFPPPPARTTAITTRQARWTRHVADLCIACKCYRARTRAIPAHPGPVVQLPGSEELSAIYESPSGPKVRVAQPPQRRGRPWNRRPLARGKPRIIARRVAPHWEKTGDILQAVYDSEVTTFETVLQQFGIHEPTSLDKQAVEYARSHWEKKPADEVKRAVERMVANVPDRRARDVRRV